MPDAETSRTASAPPPGPGGTDDPRRPFHRLGTSCASPPSLSGRTVLQVLPALETGGAERTAVDVAAAVVAAGGRAIVMSAGGRMTAALAEAGAEHIASPVGRKAPWALLASARRIAAVVEGTGVDLLHARSRAPAWAALFAARRAGVPFVTTYHGAYSQTTWAKGLYNSVMARGDLVIANSAYTAGLVVARHPFAQDRIRVVPRGTDIAAFQDPDAAERGRRLRALWGVGEGQPLVLHLARLTPWKGQAILVAAMARLAAAGRGNVVAILAGDHQGRAGYRDGLLSGIAAAGLSGRVRLVGHVDDVAAAMTAATVVVVPSVEPEAFGRAAVEAQAAGVPVVVSDLGAVRETVLAPPDVPDAARTGWRVPAGDPDALAEAVGAVLSLGPGARSALARRAQAHVAASFSLSAMVQRTLCIYAALLD